MKTINLITESVLYNKHSLKIPSVFEYLNYCNFEKDFEEEEKEKEIPVKRFQFLYKVFNIDYKLYDPKLMVVMHELITNTFKNEQEEIEVEKTEEKHNPNIPKILDIDMEYMFSKYVKFYNVSDKEAFETRINLFFLKYNKISTLEAEQDLRYMDLHSINARLKHKDGIKYVEETRKEKTELVKKSFKIEQIKVDTIGNIRKIREKFSKLSIGKEV